jgi:N-acetylglucosamine-6-sulfatase
VTRSYPFFIIPLLMALFAVGDDPSDQGQKKAPIVKESQSAEERKSAEKEDSRPNIIFILTDDQDTASLRAMPRLLRSFPLRFENHILTDPVCCPSRETFMTGQYAHNHGVRSNSKQPELAENGKSWGGWWAAGSRKENIGRWLKRDGYYTSLVGKYLNGFDATKPPPKGWNDTFLALDDEDKGFFNYKMLDNGTLREYGEKKREYSSTVMTDRAIDNIKESKKKGKPLFLFLSYNTPHSGSISSRPPALNPEPHPRDRKTLKGKVPDVSDAPSYNHKDPRKASYLKSARKISEKKRSSLQRKLYSRWSSLLSLDREIARLLKAVEKSGEMDNTYFFFTTDNGFFLGEHRLVGKFLPYDEATRFPLLVRGPGVSKGQREEMVANIDFVPTVLDLANSKAVEGHKADGKSMLSLINGDVIPWRQEVVMETFPTINYKRGPHQPYVAIRSKNDVLIRYQKNGIWPTSWNGEEEYYNLDVDPYQLSNEIDNPSFQKRIRELRRKSKILKDCAAESCP